MTPQAPRGPFCTVPGCVDPAEGAVSFAYAKPQQRYLCERHMRPIRRALLKLLDPEQVPA